MDGTTVVEEGSGAQRSLLVGFGCCGGGCPSRRRLQESGLSRVQNPGTCRSGLVAILWNRAEDAPRSALEAKSLPAKSVVVAQPR